MTKERRLAIQMWKEIKAYIKDAKSPKRIDVFIVNRIKNEFEEQHDLHWQHGCWLCQYVRYHDKEHGEGCQRCPLSDGSANAVLGIDPGCKHNAFHRVLDARLRKTKLKACDEIIRILNGGLK